MPNVSDILQTETQRLNDKKNAVDNAVAGQRRLIHFNENYRKRYSQYTQISVIFVLGIAGFLGISMLPRIFPIIPSVVADILVILLIVVLFFIGMSYYNTLSSRDVLDYDELAIAPIVDGSNATMAGTDTQNQILAQSVDSGSITDFIEASGGSLCIGSECCPTKWDANNNKCGFTTLTNAYESQQISDQELKQSLHQPYKKNHIVGTLQAPETSSSFDFDVGGEKGVLEFTAYK